MHTPFATLVGKVSRLFDTQGTEALCEHYIFPLPVHSGGQYHIFRGPRELQSAFIHFRNQRSACGLVNPVARIVASELPRKGRFRIWVDWTFTDAKSLQPVHERAIYFCSQIGQRVAIDMIACSGTMDHGAGCTAVQRQFA